MSEPIHYKNFGLVDVCFGDVDGFPSPEWGSKKRPKLNWSAVGPVPIHKAKMFLRHLSSAIKHAEKLRLDQSVITK